MKAEEEVTFLDLIQKLNELEVRSLIIGRRAVILYGGPVLTADHDLWVHWADKKRTLSFLSDDLKLDLSCSVGTKKPIVAGYSGMRKYDLFFHRKVTNIEDEIIEFEACYRNAVVIEDEKEGILFRVPSVDDLIRLKKIREPNVKDEQDIAYLLKAKQLLKRKK
jgi:hypothetical protein